MTVTDNVAFGLRMEGLGGAARAARVDEYLELVGLSGFGGRYPQQLSGGQQQRVALARALAKRPAVLLLDEPLGALDLKLRRQMQLELSRIHRQVGTTFVFVTHDQEEALSMATRIAVMSGGHVVQIGTPSEIYHRPVDRFVADFIGESNFIDGRVESGAFVLPGGQRLAIGPGLEPGPATLMVRPEVLEVGGSDESRPGCQLPGRVVGISFMGNHTRITLETAAGALVVHRAHMSGATEDPRTPGLGEEACVWWATERSTILASKPGGEH
jgi:spermidine/putrescine transport system ATP-binding protein